MKIKFERDTTACKLSDLRPGDVFGYGTNFGMPDYDPKGQPNWCIVTDYPCGDNIYWVVDLSSGFMRQAVRNQTVVKPQEVTMYIRADDKR